MPEQSRRTDPPAWLLLPAFTAIAIVLAFPAVTRLRSSVAGNSGDSLLNLWIMRSVQRGLPHGWHTFWSTQIFHPARDTLGYSETLLPEALVHGILRPLTGDALAFNLIYLAAWVLCSWWTYLLARRVVTHWSAAFVAALAFTYSSVRLAHHGHFQLVVGGAFVPLVILLLLRLLERPTPWRGVALGLAFAATALTASYYGAMLAVAMLVVLGGWIVAQRRWPTRAQVVAIAAAAGTVLVLVAPISAQYVRIQRDPAFRHAFDPTLAARFGDFLAAGSPNHVLHALPGIGTSSAAGRGLEHRLFPGLIAFGFGVLGAWWLGRAVWRRDWRTGRARDLVLVTSAGFLATILAFGDWFHVGGQRIWLPFALLRNGLPGFAGIRAVSRFAILGELALVLLAAVGLDRVLHRIAPRPRAVVGALVIGLVVAESAIGLQFVRVPTTRDDGGVNLALRREPRGVVLELPILSSADPDDAQAFVEAPRELAAVSDNDPRVNGYSGFEPAGFNRRARRLNRFPARGALAEARALGVRYVVLRTQLVGPVTPAAARKALAADGVGRYSDDTAQEMLRALPPAAVSKVEKLPGGYLITLR